jgi:hypothetical protein
MTLSLPPHLAPWAPQLGLFPEEIALVVGPMVARLASLIGNSPRDLAQEGSPNGYDGIARKGPYERLLGSEWLLLEELPDEFMRRAVSGEHLFLQQAFQENAAAKNTIALFDAGPDQLGAPRLAQIALLIVLAQRAARQGADLQWGIFQDTSPVLFEGATKGSVWTLLKARRTAPVAPSDIDRWMGLPSFVRASEIWFIGAESLSAAAQRRQAMALTVSEVLEPGAPQRIRVKALSPKAGRAKEAVLDIPPGRPAVQVLRDPFGAASGDWQAASHRIDTHSPIIFSPDGRKLYVRGADGALLIFWIPNSPKAKTRGPAAFAPPEGHTIIAAGQIPGRKRTFAISQSGNELTLYELTKRAANAKWTQVHTAAKDGYVLPPAHDLPLRPLGVLNERFCFIHVDGSVVELADKQFQIAAQSAVASRSTRDAFVYVRLRQNVPSVMAVRAGKSGDIEIEEVAVKLPPAEKDTGYFFSGWGLADLLAYSKANFSCTVAYQQESETFAIPPGHTVAGMAVWGAPKPRPAVIAIDNSRTRIDALYPGGVSETLLTSPAKIAFAAASDATSVVAFITETGELGVYCCWSKAMLLQATSEAKE